MLKTYRIGEVAALLNLKTYVLRFWETEFPQLAPLRTGKGQRLYTEGHVRRRIQELVHEQGLTLDGARRVLKQDARKPKEHGADMAAPRRDDMRALLAAFRQELLDMRALLRAERTR